MHEQNRTLIFVNGEAKRCEELSLPELKASQKEHKIVLDGHCNKGELIELLK